MGTKDNIVSYFWQIIYSHTIAYFVAGLFALIVVKYRDLFATGSNGIIYAFRR
jgi:hypothetical protein